VRGFPSNKNVKEGYPHKTSYFTAIGSSSLKPVADTTDILLTMTSTGDKLFRAINIDDLKRL